MQVEDTGAELGVCRSGSFVFVDGKWCAAAGSLDSREVLLELSPSQPRCVSAPSAYGAPQLLLLSVHLRTPPTWHQEEDGDRNDHLLEVTLGGRSFPVTVTVAGEQAHACETGHGFRLGPSYFTAGVDSLLEAVVEVDLSSSQEAAPEPVLSSAAEIAEGLVPAAAAAAAGVTLAGMLRINLWAPGRSDDGGSGSRLLASERVLLLPEGFDLAAEEVAALTCDCGDAQDLVTDLALVIESAYRSREGGIRPALSTSHSAVLRSMAEDLLEWAVAADDFPATASLLGQLCKQRLTAEVASDTLDPPPPELSIPCSRPEAGGVSEAGGSCSRENSEIYSQRSEGDVTKDRRVRPQEGEGFYIPVSAAWAGAFVTHGLVSCSYQVYRDGYGKLSRSLL